MTPEQAKLLLNEIYLPQIQREHKTTRRVIESVPADKCDWKPDPKSMSALDLAWHIASSEWFFLNGIVKGEYKSDGGPTGRPEALRTPADVLKWDDEHFATVTSHLAQLKAEDLLRVIDFFGVFQFPASAYAELMCSHSIHHRGQLSTYLRPMGSKVPSIYGPSGDEEVRMPAQANA